MDCRGTREKRAIHVIQQYRHKGCANSKGSTSCSSEYPTFRWLVAEHDGACKVGYDIGSTHMGEIMPKEEIIALHSDGDFGLLVWS